MFQLCAFDPVLCSSWFLTPTLLVSLETSPRLIVDQISSTSPTFLGRCSRPTHKLRPHLSSVSTVHGFRDTSTSSSSLPGNETRQIWLLTPTSFVFLLPSSVASLLVVFGASVTKAYLQAKPSQCLIIYDLFSEFFGILEQFNVNLCKAFQQLYGEVGVGLYWCHTFVPLIVKNIFQVQHIIYDPSLFMDRSKFVAILLCKDYNSFISNSSTTVNTRTENTLHPNMP